MWNNGVLLIIFIFTFDSVLAVENPCKYQEYRCRDGSGCLKVEKLCNEVADCDDGEDETGDGTWNCDKLETITVKDCETYQVPCRFSPVCVNRTQLCKGKFNCAGGSDDSIELCYEVAGYEKKRDRTTAKPQKPVTFISDSCGTLFPDDAGMKVVCHNPDTQEKINCLEESSPLGTIATYSCKPFYVSPLSGSRITQRKCQPNGSWSALRRNFYCALECGKQRPVLSPFIVKGFTSPASQWPWMANFYQPDPPNSSRYKFYCGGSLISTNAILTAAHCITKPGTTEKRNDQIIIKLGKYYRSFNKNETHVQERSVVQIEIHDYYNYQTLHSDIAIIWLNEPVSITDQVRPICLPVPNEPIETGDIGTIIGFGRTNVGPNSTDSFKEELQQANLPVVGFTKCQNSHPSFSYLSAQSSFCAGYRNGTSACDGDSGSGYFLQDPLDRNWRIHGIISSGIAGKGGGCNANHYSVFTKVSSYRLWIDAMLDREFRK